MTITVAICTYNRRASLERTLATLACARVPPGCDWEVVVVDNNSTENIASIVEVLQGALPLRYIPERQQGLSHARNRALREARGDVVIFTDDDMDVAPGWLEEYSAALDRFQRADYFGGRILPQWSGEPPRWWSGQAMDLLDGLLGRYELGEEVRTYSPGDPLPYGGNFALRRRLFERVGRFRPDLGVSGPTPGRGEETEYLKRARMAGFQGVYVGKAVCLHRIDAGRFQLRFLYEYGVQKGIAEIRTRGVGAVEAGSRCEGPVFLLRGIAQLLRGRRDRFYQCVVNMGIASGVRRALQASRCSG